MRHPPSDIGTLKLFTCIQAMLVCRLQDLWLHLLLLDPAQLFLLVSSSCLCSLPRSCADAGRRCPSGPWNGCCLQLRHCLPTESVGHRNGPDSLRFATYSRNTSRIALVGALAFSLIGAVCIFELLVLSEVLSLFFIALSSCLFLCAMHALREQTDFKWPSICSGLCFSLAILTRPENLVFFVILIGCVLFLSARCRYVPPIRWAMWSLARLAALLVVSAAPLVILWMSWNLLSIGEFRLTTLTGLARTESVYNLFGLLSRICGLIPVREAVPSV